MLIIAAERASRNNDGTLTYGFGDLLSQYVPGIDPSVPFESPRPLESVEQRWFVGSHGNVGGGSYDDLLSQLPLRRLMSKAEKHGLAFRQSLDIDEKAAAGEIDDSFKAFLKGSYSLLHAEQRYWRPMVGPRRAARTRWFIRSMKP